MYGILFGMPGVPCVYYGSEWGMEGGKEDGDAALRLLIFIAISADILLVFPQYPLDNPASASNLYTLIPL